MSIAHYLLQVNIYLVVFYGFYKLLLDKETYFTFNRIYLVSAGLLSLAIPFLRFEWFNQQEAIQPVYVSVGHLMSQVAIIEDAPTGFNAGNLIVLIYISGMIYFSLKLIMRLMFLHKKMKRLAPGDAFSFFWKKRIDPSLPGLGTIHRHEDAHIRQWHSADVLFFEVLNIFTWFNPVSYFYKNAVKSIHEYLADEDAAKFQGNKEQYALLLLSNAFGVPVNTLTNSFFNKSLIKKRIFMLHKPRSPKMAVLKYGLFVPLFAVALIMSSATIRSNEKIQEIAEQIPLNSPIELVKAVVQEQRQIPAGWEEFYSYLKQTVKYPVLAQKDKIQGTTMIKFSVAAGQVESVAIATKLAGGCDAEAMRRIVSFPDYKSIKDGNYTLEVEFSLQGSEAPKRNEKIEAISGYTALNKVAIVGFRSSARYQGSETNGGDKVYDFVSLDTQPSFEGGMRNFYEYLKTSIKYPAEALKLNVQGKVFLSFIVEKDGTLNDIRIERGLGAGTDEEAVRVLHESPKWVPGTQNGKPVRVKYNLPISFSTNKTPVASGSTQNKQVSTVQGIRFSDDKGSEMKFGENNEKTPLYVIDGKLSDAAGLKALSPNEIESINILKGAAATALYGAKGANGVVSIITKLKLLEKKEGKTAN